MTEQQPADDLIARVLAGEASDDERRMVEAWAASAPQRREHLDRLHRGFRARAPEGGWDVDRAWTRVSAQIESLDHEVEVIPIPRAPHWRTTVLRVAAAVLLVVGAVFAWQAIGGAPLEYATAAGEVLDVALADGTQVTLAPNSRLSVPHDLAANRTLRLDGEGWFAVGDASKAVFEVMAGDYAVRDVGTSFTLRSRQADSLRVVVVEGAVIVTRDGRPVGDTVVAGDIVSIGGVAMSHETGDAGAMASWRNGALAFAAVPAGQVVARLSEWHGTTIVIADALLATRPITVTFDGESLDDALDVLTLLLGVQAERDDGRIVLH